MIIYKSFRERT